MHNKFFLTFALVGQNRDDSVLISFRVVEAGNIDLATGGDSNRSGTKASSELVERGGVIDSR